MAMSFKITNQGKVAGFIVFFYDCGEKHNLVPFDDFNKNNETLPLFVIFKAYIKLKSRFYVDPCRAKN